MKTAINKVESRTRVLDLPFGIVEDLHRSPASAAKSPDDFSTDFQICLPYAGFFLWHVGKDTCWAIRISHFTFMFRRAFGCTPSQFRDGTRCP